MQFWVKALITVAGIISSASVMGQASYKPGQTFSATGATPTPAPPPVVYRQPVPAAPVQRQAPVRPSASSAQPMYNISHHQPQARTASQVSTNEKSESVTTAHRQTEAVRNNVEKNEESAKHTAKSEPKSETPSETKTETSVASAHPVTPDSTDKLMYFSRKTGKKWIALTYDDGPNPAYTPKLVEYLKANNVPATFFLCGNMVKDHPATAKMLVDEGFEIGNHTYDHPQLTKLSKEKIIDQLQDTHDLIKEATGVDVKLMRPPYGAQNSTVREICEQLGYKIIQWDVDTEDWRKRPASVMLSTIMKQAGDGSIILMHDRKHGSMDTVLETTRNAVDQLRAKGYTFVTVGQLIDLNHSQDTSAIASNPESTGTASQATLPSPASPITSMPLVSQSNLPAPPAQTPASILP